MKKLLIKIFIFLIIFIIPNLSFAENKVNKDLEKKYNSIIKKIEKKYNSEKELKILKILNSKLYEIKDDKKKLNIINDLLKLNNEKIFDLTYKSKIKDKNLDKYSITKEFKNRLLFDKFFFLENWVWYTYRFKKFGFFPKWFIPKQYDLDYNNINKNNDIIFINWSWSLWFIINFKKVKLIDDDIIYGIANKFNFLVNIEDDKTSLHEDTDLLFKKLKNISLDLTKNIKSKDKIKVLYDFVLNNIQYTKKIDLEDKRIFSWIHTYKNNDWTCLWYSKLFSYMLSFVWINDNEVIKWFVIDAQDFPKIWHAWVKINNKYFDPTFDDPNWLDKTKVFDEYKYFNLPKDLFYTNRFDYWNTPENIKKSSIAYRKTLVKWNIFKLVDKYKNNNYKLIKPYTFRKKYNIGLHEDFSINNIKKIIPLLNVNDFKYYENNKIKQLKSFQYFLINDEKKDKTEELLNQLNFDLKWFYLFKWENNDWTFDYRLAYNLVFN